MRWILTIALVFSLAACGYKGALFLPKEPKVPEKPPAYNFTNQQPATASETK